MGEDLFKNATIEMIDKNTNEVVCKWDGSIDNIKLIEISPCLPPISSERHKEIILISFKILRAYKYNKRMRRTNELYKKRKKKYGKGL